MQPRPRSLTLPVPHFVQRLLELLELHKARVVGDLVEYHARWRPLAAAVLVRSVAAVAQVPRLVVAEADHDVVVAVAVARADHAYPLELAAAALVHRFEHATDPRVLVGVARRRRV